MKISKAFVMSVNAGQEKECEQRHRPIWPELEVVLKKHGVHNSSIFLHAETRQLFAYAEIEDEARWQAIAQTPECQKWWQHMGDIMPPNPDHPPRQSLYGKCSTSISFPDFRNSSFFNNTTQPRETPIRRFRFNCRRYP